MCVGEKLHVVIFVLTMVIRLQARDGGWEGRKSEVEEVEDAFDEVSYQEE